MLGKGEGRHIEEPKETEIDNLGQKGFWGENCLGVEGRQKEVDHKKRTFLGVALWESWEDWLENRHSACAKWSRFPAGEEWDEQNMDGMCH